ncbi:MAG: hypothetical protein JKY96_09400, partial [Phycisphaerales bacterium]|nr:hypothetical protein [Phycisphaerales bacterium]
MNLLDCLYIPIGIVTAPLWARKKRDGWGQRFGHIQEMLQLREGGATRKRVLLHAVSVGEVNALRALVPMLGEQVDVVVSTTTDTGLARAVQLFAEIESCEVVRYPLDCSWMVRRFLDAVKPDVVGLVELEVWPNFVKACVRRDIPIGLINGRLSARSFKGYKKLRPLLRPTFRRLAFACMQDASYAERVTAMGVPEARVSVTDSMKWDSVDVDRASEGASDRALSIALSMGLDLSRRIVVAGSTGPNEEHWISQACPDDVQLICAPRKPERFDEAAAAMVGCTRRSRGFDSTKTNTRFLLDTIGELSTVYELADVVIVGRSFCNLYGSDPIEPAALGKPVIIGPNNSDFTD